MWRTCVSTVFGLRNSFFEMPSFESPSAISAVRAAARGQDDRERRVVVRKPLGDREPVEVGQLDVEQDDVGAQLSHRSERGRSVRSLADDVERARLEQRASRSPKRAVVVDDEHGLTQSSNCRKAPCFAHRGCP